jgi:hypothetical protein
MHKHILKKKNIGICAHINYVRYSAVKNTKCEKFEEKHTSICLPICLQVSYYLCVNIIFITRVYFFNFETFDRNKKYRYAI